MIAKAVPAAIILIIAAAALAGPEHITFPTDYRESFHHYATSERPQNRQIRDLYANPQALDGVRRGELQPGAQIVMEIYQARSGDEGAPLRDGDGRIVRGALMAVAVMEKGDGWGEAYPDEIRNGAWEFGFFTPGGQLRTDVDNRPCMECHKPLADNNFLFSFEALAGHRR